MWASLSIATRLRPEEQKLGEGTAKESAGPLGPTTSWTPVSLVDAADCGLRSGCRVPQRGWWCDRRLAPGLGPLEVFQNWSYRFVAHWQPGAFGTKRGKRRLSLCPSVGPSGHNPSRGSRTPD